MVGHFASLNQVYQPSFSVGVFVNKKLLVKLAKAPNEATSSKLQLRLAEASRRKYLLVPTVEACCWMALG